MAQTLRVTFHGHEEPTDEAETARRILARKLETLGFKPVPRMSGRVWDTDWLSETATVTVEVPVGLYLFEARQQLRETFFDIEKAR
jgi:hypothetical protein